MIKVFVNLFDRCLFTVSFILGAQVPEFMQQYSQRLSGHLDEAQHQLQQFQLIAANSFQGDLQAMIKRFHESLEPSIIQTGDLIVETINRISVFEQHLANMQQADYLRRLYSFIVEQDTAMVQATFQQYQLAMPLNLSALVTGFSLAIILISTNNTIIYLGKSILFPKRFTSKEIKRLPS